MGHQLHLFHADPVFSRDRPSHGDAELQNFFACFLCAFEVACAPWVERKYRMHVAVPGMEYVADRDLVFAADLFNRPQSARNLLPGDNSVLHVVGGTYPPNCPKRVLSPLPKQVSLGGTLRNPNLARAAGPANVTDLLCLFF